MNIAALALASALSASVDCSWNNPGVNPYMGEIPAAVDNYKDIPWSVRENLKAKMVFRRYDDIVLITKNEIVGKNEYGNLREMHFGNNSMCKTVKRDGWSEKAQERGLVFCDSGYCVVVPTVCRNVSRIDKLKVAEPQKILEEPNKVEEKEEEKVVHTVPEPNSLLQVLAGLVACFLILGLKRKY